MAANTVRVLVSLVVAGLVVACGGSSDGDNPGGGGSGGSEPPVPVCGNGVVEDGEACDDGNDDDTDACLTTCVAARCGDGIVHAGVET